MFIINSIRVFKRYSFLLQQLVSRDFKVKYKRSVLGVLWSVLNPLFMMCIMTVVFENVFRLGGGTVNYPVYLLTGLVFWNYFNEATSLGLGAVVGNFNLITKVYMPKYIFPLSKVLSTSLNFLFSFIALYVIILWQGVPITIAHLFLPFDIVYIIIFAIGVSMFISTLTVFFRDMFYIYGVLMTAWMYFTPIMYTMDLIEKSKYGWWAVPLMKLNPMYHYINYARDIIFGTIPSLHANLICLGASLLTLIIGLLFFRSKQDKFIYHM